MNNQDTIPHGDVLLTPEQAEAETGYSKRTLANKRCDGTGPPFFRMGRLIRYSKLDIHEWMRSRRYRSTSEVSVESQRDADGVA